MSTLDGMVKVCCFFSAFFCLYIFLHFLNFLEQKCITS